MRPWRISLFAFLLISAMVALVAVACGGDATEPDVTLPESQPATAAPDTEPVVTEPEPMEDPPQATAAPEEVETVSEPLSDSDALAEYAAERAGGPGAIFVGDAGQIVGLPPHESLMFELTEEQYIQASAAALAGMPTMGIPGHMFIFRSDYYQDLVDKANLTNPTELTSSGESIKIQHACIDRNLAPCVIVQHFWAPNLAERTNGQVELSVVSFPELGVQGPETLVQVSDGTLDMVNLYAGYVAGSLPALEIQALWGSSNDWETTYSMLVDLAPDVDQIVADATGGSHVLNRNWFAGSDQWLYGNQPLRTVADFEGKKIRSHGAALSDFIGGMGAEPVFLGHAEAYTALERGFVDANPTGVLLAIPQQLFEIADYMAGPLIGFGYTPNVINKDVWDDIPQDLQQIIIEEGAKAELEALRLSPFQNVIPVQINQQLGVELVPFSEEIIQYIRKVVLPEHILPGWLDRLGYPGSNEAIIEALNNKISPYMGYWINEDGSIREVPITKGPRSRE